MIPIVEITINPKYIFIPVAIGFASSGLFFRQTRKNITPISEKEKPNNPSRNLLIAEIFTKVDSS